MLPVPATGVRGWDAAGPGTALLSRDVLCVLLWRGYSAGDCLLALLNDVRSRGCLLLCLCRRGMWRRRLRI